MKWMIHLLLCLLAIVGNLSSPAGAATYYLDNIGGNDANNGTSSNAAWQNLSKASATIFQPGDRLLLKAGGTWTGELDLNGDGTAASPIVVDQYGTGSKPLINGGGYESAVRLQGVSYWEVNNVEIINDGGTTQSGATNFRAGVLVKSASTAIRRHIYLRNLTIHDIFPQTGAEGHGIYVLAACSSTVGTYYDDVRIENCQISRTGRFGVQVQQTGSTQTTVANQFNRNIIIRDNTFTNTGGSGAETGWCSDVLLEGNIVNYSGASVDVRQWARGSGYWPFKCKNVLVQNNQFRHARGEADSCGVHIDFGNRDVTIQYNLSLDNEGGFVEILGDCINSIYRYNVSINDGARIKGVNGASQDGHLIWLSDYVGDTDPGVGSSNSMIYNNTIYVRSGITNYLKIMAGTVGTFIRNNVFIMDGTSTYTNAGTNTVFQNNLWWGNVPAGVPTGSGSIIAYPEVALQGGTIANDYLISGTSPAIAAGLVITNNGGLDYWGNTLPPGAPCIGAHQREYAAYPPVANGSTVSTPQSAFIDIDLQMLVSDVETPLASLKLQPGAGTNGTVTLLADRRTARFTPTAGYSGPASFTYTVTDTTRDQRTVLNYAFQNSNVTDTSGQGRNATLNVQGTGAATFATDSPLAGYTKCIALTENSTAGAVRVERSLSTAEVDLANGDWTIAGWFKRNAATNIDVVMQLGSSGSYGPSALTLGFYGTGSTLELRNYTSVPTQDIGLSKTNVLTGTWNHFAIVRSGSVISWYHNGVLVGSDNAFALDITNSQPVKFGGSGSTSVLDRWFNGSLADLAVFDAALAPADITKLTSAPVQWFGGQSTSATINVNVLAPIDTWRQTQFGTTSNTGIYADNADKDNDGLVNLIEYACATNPNTHNGAPYSAARNGSNLEYTYSKNKSATDVTYTVEWSDSLGNDWSTVGVSSIILTDNGTTQQIKATLPAGVNGRRFVRLRITNP